MDKEKKKLEEDKKKLKEDIEKLEEVKSKKAKTYGDPIVKLY